MVVSSSLNQEKTSSFVSSPIKIPVKIQLFDSSLPLPEYQTAGAVGFDLYAREETTVDPHSLVLVPLNIAVQIPEGFWLMLSARSSLCKKGLMLANGLGIIDNDYCGPEDELRAALRNISNQTLTISRGERIVQGIFIPKIVATWQPVKQLDASNRGGFGTTGTNATFST